MFDMVQTERQKELQRLYRERQNANRPPKFCEVCGKNAIDINRRYCCPECAKAGAKIKLAARTAKQKEFDDMLKPKPKELPKKIKHGWCLDGKDAMRISAEAKAVELSYGKYVEYIKAGTFGGMPYIERVLRESNIYDGLQRIEAVAVHKRKQRRKIDD